MASNDMLEGYLLDARAKVAHSTKYGTDLPEATTKPAPVTPLDPLG